LHAAAQLFSQQDMVTALPFLLILVPLLAWILFPRSNLRWMLFKIRVRRYRGEFTDARIAATQLAYALRRHLTSLESFIELRDRKIADELDREATDLLEDFEWVLPQVSRSISTLAEVGLSTISKRYARKVDPRYAHIELLHELGILGKRELSRFTDERIYKSLEEKDPVELMRRGIDRLGYLLLENRKSIWLIVRSATNGGNPYDETRRGLRSALFIAGGILMIFGDVASVPVRGQLDVLLASTGAGIVALAEVL
jgi:hypothetical protein